MIRLLLIGTLLAAPLYAGDFPFGSIITSGFPVDAGCRSGRNSGFPVANVYDRGGTMIWHEGGPLAVTAVGHSIVGADQLGQEGGFSVLGTDRVTPFTNMPLGPRRGTLMLALALTPAGSDAVLALVINQTPPLLEFWLVTRAHGLLLRRGLPERNDIDIAPPDPIAAIDADSSGCIVYYTTNRSIARFNVCANVALSDFAVTRATAIRVLPDGGLLAGKGEILARYDRDGRFLSYVRLSDGNREIGALAIDVDPRLAWVLMRSADPCDSTKSTLLLIDIDSGAILNRLETDTRLIDRPRIAVAGGWYAVGPTSFPPPRRRGVR